MHPETTRNRNLQFLYFKNTPKAEENTEPPVTRAKYKCFSEQGLNIDNVRKTVTVVKPPAQFNTGKNKSAVLHLCNLGHFWNDHSSKSACYLWSFSASGYNDPWYEYFLFG